MSFNLAGGAVIAVSLMLTMPSDVRGEAAPAKKVLSGVALTPLIEGQNLIFLLQNNTNDEIIVYRDYCFDTHLTNSVVEARDLSAVVGSFSSGIIRDSGSFVIVKRGETARCELNYYPAEIDAKYESAVLIWKTNLFVGRENGSYESEPAYGILEVKSNLANVSLSHEPAIDEVVRSAFKRWKRRD